MSSELTALADNELPPDALVTIDLTTGGLTDTPRPTLILDPSSIQAEVISGLAGHTDVAVHFSKATDGRGYSLAARIREAGLCVRLHAVGDLHPDLFYFLRRCGFDVAHLPDRQDLLSEGLAPQVAAQLLRPFAAHYQSSVDGQSGRIGRSPDLREAA